ncbi:hypothetical protein HHK36_002701 [Tetracentron sinense]|uniref:ACB domain-containing protein n=1 Tax=Tetracentron sinense TaxID=13715 RepID=A0A835DRD0_TETSI|nr:hypothetical protein HHK36_002701 [Tetracentron sinense]
MDSIMDALLTAVISFIFCFILAKLVSMASAGNVERDSVLGSREDEDGGVVMEKQEFEGELRSRGLCSERRFEFARESAKVCEFGGELVQELLEFVKEGCESSADNSQIRVEEEGLGEEINGSGLEDKSMEERFGKVEEVKDFDSGDIKEERVFSGVGVLEDKLIEERLEKTEIHEVDRGLGLDESILAKNEEGGVVGYEGDLGDEIEEAKKKKEDEEKEGLFNDYGDWEGIEKTELEKLFGDAVTFVGSRDHDGLLSSVGNDVQMQLYGLHKVATEGPCHEPKPMALKVSSRAKW